jgi:hypothetical protein
MTSEYKINITPLLNFRRTFLVIKIFRRENISDQTIYTYGLRQSRARIHSSNLNDNIMVVLGVIPYESIIESKYYGEDSKTIGQSQIKENCKNYFPTSMGNKNYWFFIQDNRRNFGIEYFPRYEIWDDFDIPANKSLYIEIDIEKREHKTSIIDTPSDIFADMCI